PRAPALFTEPGGCRPARPVSVLSMHGTADEVLPYGGQPASVASPLPLPALPAWLAEWATRDGCPGDPAVFLDTPLRRRPAPRRSGGSWPTSTNGPAGTPR